MTHSIAVYPAPISQSTSKDSDQGKQPSRTCHATWDPKRNGIALGVVPSNPISFLPLDQSKQRQAITSVPDQSLYLINASNYNIIRRSFITRSYQVFVGLQKVVQVCEEEEGMVQDQIQLPNGLRLPSTSQLKYCYRIGDQYVVALKDYLEELQKGDDVKNSKEIDLVLHMIHIFSLFVLVHIPADGRGDAIVAEEILDWVNRFNPQPSKEEGEELSALTVPYEHVNFWPYIHVCVIRGHLSQASALLKSYTKTHNPTLNQLTTVTLSLLKSVPRSTSFDQEIEFSTAVDKFRQSVERSMITLESEMNIIQETEKTRGETGASFFSEDDLLDFHANCKILLEILAGQPSRISEACFDWPEALGAYLLWVNPFCKRDDLPIVMRKVTADWPIDQTSNLDLALSSILNGGIRELIQTASKMDPWLTCHLTDLIDKLGIPLPDQSRAYYIGEFVDYLSIDQGLWRLTVAYLATVEGTKEWIREILRRLVVDELGDHEENNSNQDTMELDGQTSKVSMVEMKSIYADYDMDEELLRTARIMARRLMKQRKYGAAIAYAVTASDLKLVSRISDLLLDEYVANGPVEFARLVDEIPSSLLHPTAPTIRPNLFFDRPSHNNNNNNKDGNGEGEGAREGEESLRTPLQPNLNSAKLLFLSRYRDMHSYYSKGERRLAAETLINLMTTEIAPRRWWAVCLIDIIPILEDDEILISLADTYELLRCLEEITGPILTSSRDSYDYLKYLKQILMSGKKTARSKNQVNGNINENGNGDNLVRHGQDVLGSNSDALTRDALDQLDVVRHALSKHLARTLTCKNY